MPQGNFAALISMLTTQALFALGLIRVEARRSTSRTWRWPGTTSRCSVLEEKTKGNLTPQEEQMLKNTLSDLRMGFVSVANQLRVARNGTATPLRP